MVYSVEMNKLKAGDRVRTEAGRTGTVQPFSSRRAVPLGERPGDRYKVCVKWDDKGQETFISEEDLSKL